MMLVVRMRRGLQPAGILASSSSPGLADNILDMIEADAQPKHFDPLDLLEGIANSQNLREAEGNFLGLFPYAAIVTIIFGGLIAKLGPALEKAQRLRRTLQLEYSAQKRFLKKTGDIRA